MNCTGFTDASGRGVTAGSVVTVTRLLPGAMEREIGFTVFKLL